METKDLNIDEDHRKHVRIISLAEKYNCSRQYVSQVLSGVSPSNSPLSKKILTDASDILNIIKRDTKVTL